METTTRKASTTEIVPATKHVHPQGVQEVILGYDPDSGKRIIGAVQGRKPTYSATCKACIEADQARMHEPSALLNLSTTMFLVPEPEYDGMVARAYLKARYPECENIVHAFNAEKLSYVKGSQVVVITRRGKNGKTGPRYKRTKDEEGTFYDAPIPPEDYLHEIVESDPVIVAECIDVTPATMYADQSADFSELVARIAERAVPFRIAPPNAPDKLYTMRLNA
jgi:hypothetical protein